MKHARRLKSFTYPDFDISLLEATELIRACSSLQNGRIVVLRSDHDEEEWNQFVSATAGVSELDVGTFPQVGSKFESAHYVFRNGVESSRG